MLFTITGSRSMSNCAKQRFSERTPATMISFLPVSQIRGPMVCSYRLPHRIIYLLHSQQ